MSELLTTARSYAKALFKSAKEKNMLEKYYDMLRNLDLAVNDKDVKQILTNDSFDDKYKSNLLLEILKDSIDENYKGSLTC